MAKLPPWALLLLVLVPGALMVGVVAWRLAPTPLPEGAAVVPPAGHGATAAAPIAQAAPIAPVSLPARGAADTPLVQLRSMRPALGAAAPSPDVVALVTYAGDPAALPPAAAVFVFVRAAGQRMPIAVERFAPTDLPVRAAFGPLPGDGQQVEMVARLSLAGSVGRGPDDIEVTSAIAPETKNVQLVIPAG